MKKIFHNDVEIQGGLTLSSVTPIIQTTQGDIDIRAGNATIGQKNINLGWAYGANLYFWGGASGPGAQVAFSVLENGNGFFNGSLNAVGNYKVNGVALQTSHLADFPSQTGNTGYVLTTDGSSLSWGSNAVVWGGISGTLSSQTDLQSALDEKASLSGATFTNTIVLNNNGANLMNSNYDLDIRAGSSSAGQKNINIGWAYGANLYFWGGTSGTGAQVAFSVLENGNGFFNGNVNALGGYLVDSVALNFSHLATHPSTLSGYGITDAYPMTGNPSDFLTSASLSSYATQAWVTSQGYLTGITSAQVTAALGFTPYNATNPSGFISGITSSMVTTALGYTPYNSALTLYLTGSSKNIINNLHTLDIRAGDGTTGQDISLGYDTGYGNHLYFWGGSTNVKFSVDNAGNGYFLGGLQVNSHAINFTDLAGSVSDSQLNLGTTTAPTTNTATPPSTIYGTGAATLTTPAYWLTIHDASGTAYKVPAY